MMQIDTAELARVSQTLTLRRPRSLLLATIGVQSISRAQALRHADRPWRDS